MSVGWALLFAWFCYAWGHNVGYGEGRKRRDWEDR